MDNNLATLEQQLLKEHKLSIYSTQVACEKAVTDVEKEVIALGILKAPLPVALGMKLENDARKAREAWYEGD
jgi:hypothetical protein